MTPEKPLKEAMVLSHDLPHNWAFHPADMPSNVPLIVRIYRAPDRHPIVPYQRYRDLVRRLSSIASIEREAAAAIETLVKELEELASVSEVERLREICRDIIDVINTSPYLFQEPPDPKKVIDKIEELAGRYYPVPPLSTPLQT